MSCAADGPGPAAAATPRRSRLWWWVVAAFMLQLAAWTAWFILAAHSRIEDVPLETSPVRRAS